MAPRSYKIMVDAAEFSMVFTDEEPDGEFVFASFGEARAAAAWMASAERDAWAGCLRRIREFRTYDVR